MSHPEQFSNTQTGAVLVAEPRLVAQRHADQPNADQKVIDDFGAEWARFDQTGLSPAEQQALFDDYFSVFPWSTLPPGARGMDVGCGSGRWANLCAPKVGHLLLVDPAAAALNVAKHKLRQRDNVSFHHADVAHLPGADGEYDFAYSLGVLHHVPDTAMAIRSISAKLKPGAPFLVYLYYGLDNRPAWFRALWQLSNMLRNAIAASPRGFKHLVCEAIAATVYWPLARSARLAEVLGLPAKNLPLYFYRSLSFYTMRTDALDRFGTTLEQRFTRPQIQTMLEQAGFVDVVFREGEPYWCAVGTKAGHVKPSV
jgi:ubiquinone/menaquinone biosynthesis C-methylase UbiE